MRQPSSLLLLTVLLLAVSFTHVNAQPSTQKPATGVITGRVTLGEKAMPNVSVQLFSADRAQRGRGAMAKTTTDYEGRYKLTNIAPGGYSVMVAAPAYIVPGDGLYGESGRTVNMAEGETVEKIDFTLTRGGVITGRVTNAEGAPVIGERIRINLVDKSAQSRLGLSAFMNFFMLETDDRGVYRVFGLPPGRYSVSVGESGEEGEIRNNTGKRSYYTRTFHPSATEEAKAMIIELKEGSEATNVDITLGRASKTFSASGRVVDATGKPVPRMRVGSGTVAKDRKQIASFGMMAMTDSEGRFRLDGFLPGQYAAFTWNDGQSDGYSNPTTFEITDGDISGIELKMRRGESINGMAIIEGTTDRAVLAKLSELTLWASPMVEDDLSVRGFSPVRIAPDGSFRISGLQPGKVVIQLATYPPIKGFTLVRVERDGTPVQEIEITQGTEVTNVRVVLEYGVGSVRGMVKVENGTLPEGTRMMVHAQRLNQTSNRNLAYARVDSRGTFLIEDLATGEYELTLRAYITLNRQQPRPPQAKQRVSVISGAESTVTLTLDLNAKPAEDNEQ